jgi:hypothetical protein
MLDSKISYFEKNGTEGTNPRTNEEAYREWLKRLTFIKRDNYAVEWARNMIRVAPEARLTAPGIMAQILECDDDGQYYGLCCDGHDGEDIPTQLKDSDFEEDASSDGKHFQRNQDREYQMANYLWVKG